ncbi:MAG: hypothetical protein L0027_00170 [Candidatus Rokubacteria bacterium]|nr:hypothetical protein [Candidatus Rokubacteria bacterium]
MILYHVAIVTSPDYLARRDEHREAHLRRLLELRARGFVVGGGPAPDGRSAEVFYRVPDEAALKTLIEEDPYFAGALWTGWQPRAFDQFLDPRETPALVTDGSRRVSLVEGRAPDVDLASFALVEARAAGRMAFGGFFGGGDTLAVMRTADGAEAARWLDETGLWAAEILSTRPLLHVL